MSAGNNYRWAAFDTITKMFFKNKGFPQLEGKSASNFHLVIGLLGRILFPLEINNRVRMRPYQFHLFIYLSSINIFLRR